MTKVCLNKEFVILVIVILIAGGYFLYTKMSEKDIFNLVF